MRNVQAQRQALMPPLPFALHEERHSIEEFTYIVAHDLSGPLNRIVSFVRLLEEKYRPLFDPQALRYLDLISENGRQAQAHLSGLVQYSRLDTEPQAYEKVDSKEIIERCLDQLKAEIGNREALIHVSPLPEIMGDRERLELLFYHLISNALKFCIDRPDITISASYEDDSWIFSVRDCGIGIAPKDYEEIFHIFSRVHQDSEYPGGGMGLTLARRIAELHGGSIEVESHPGEGAIFYVILPEHDEDDLAP